MSVPMTPRTPPPVVCASWVYNGTQFTLLASPYRPLTTAEMLARPPLLPPAPALIIAQRSSDAEFGPCWVVGCGKEVKRNNNMYFCKAHWSEMSEAEQGQQWSLANSGIGGDSGEAAAPSSTPMLMPSPRSAGDPRRSDARSNSSRRSRSRSPHR